MGIELPDPAEKLCVSSRPPPPLEEQQWFDCFTCGEAYPPVALDASGCCVDCRPVKDSKTQRFKSLGYVKARRACYACRDSRARSRCVHFDAPGFEAL